MSLFLSLALLLGPVDGTVSAAEDRGAPSGSVPQGTAVAAVLPLSLHDAVERGLAHNLRLLLAEQGVRSARGARWEAKSDLLPHLSGRLAATRQKINLEAFGFSGFPGVPTLVGPFNVVDMRATVTQSVFDEAAIFKDRAEAERVSAARSGYEDAREVVVLACGNLYLQALGEKSRIDSARAQLGTAQALYDLAADRKKAGLVPGIDVLRAEVVLKGRQQQVVVAENRFERAKLGLARAIGLPLGQAFELTDEMAALLGPSMSVDEALQRAYETRADWRQAQHEVRAAEAQRRSSLGEGLPSLDVNLDYGAIGQTFAGAHATYTLGATLHVPILQGGKVYGKVVKDDAELQARRAQLEDLRSRIDYEVRTSALDLDSARRRVDLAESALVVAREQLRQAQDRFAAGVANNVDVVQAQEALANASDERISVLYDANLAQAAMARAVGLAEAAFRGSAARREGE
jgi:outer membrane protein TolC